MHTQSLAVDDLGICMRVCNYMRIIRAYRGKVEVVENAATRFPHLC